MKKYFAVAIAMFILFLIVFAPASIVRRALNDVPDVDLLQPGGTLWSGSGTLVVLGSPLGDVQWQLAPSALLSADLAADYQLDGPGIAVTGRAGLGSGLTIDGDVELDALAAYLRPYDLQFEGRLRADAVRVSAEAADGHLYWSGGLVRYILSGERGSARLPPMVAALESASQGPRAVVRMDAEAAGATNSDVGIRSDAPLIEAELRHDGFVSIGVTKALTKMLNKPWPGSDPDDAVVLQVEEQFFDIQ